MAKKVETTRLAITAIRTDGGTQTRAGMDSRTVLEYAEAMTEGVEFPPVVAFYDGTDYFLADGFHRVAAARRNGFLEIDAEVRQGTRRDAVLFSVGANAQHGLRRSQADKRRAVETLLADEEWRQWSNHVIAQRCNVSPPFVGKVREATGSVSSERKYVNKHGQEAVMETAGIGQPRIQNPESRMENAPAVSTGSLPATPPPGPLPSTEEMGDELTPQEVAFGVWLGRVNERVDAYQAEHPSDEPAACMNIVLAESFNAGEFRVLC
jgi:hypothetical protein